MAASMKILKAGAADVFSLIFVGFYCSYGDISVNLWQLQGENMRTINFIWKWNS